MITQGTVAKSISYEYDSSDDLLGDKIIVSAMNPETDEELVPKKTVPKDGTFALAFPMEYEGEVEILLEGVDGGSDGPARFLVEA